MQFESIRITNFLSVKDVSYSFRNHGLVLVEGENKDSASASSNGSGKTNCFTEALTWCLFGVTTKGLRSDAVLPSFGGSAKVAVSLEVGGRNVEIIRERGKSSNLTLKVNGKDISKSVIAATEETLKKLLGVDRESFLYTTVLGQGMSFRFTQLTDAQQKALIESIIQVDLYEQARQLAKTQHKEARLAHDASLRTSTQLADGIVRAKSVVAAVQKAAAVREQSLARKKEEAAATIADLKVRLDAVLAEREAAELAAATAQQIQERLEAISVPLPTQSEEHVAVSGQVALVRTAIAKLGKIPTGECPTCGSEVDAEHLLEHKRTELVELEARLKGFVADYTKRKDRYTSYQESLQRARHNAANQGAALTANHRAEEQLVADIARVEQQSSDVDSEVVEDFGLAEAEAALLEVEANHAAATKESADLQEKARVLEFWVDGFQAIRISLVAKIISFINSRLKAYAQVLTDGEIVPSLCQTDKGKLGVRVTSKGGTYESASGGEKDRIDLAFAFALHDLASQQTNFRSNILILDEPGNFLDIAGIERLMRLIQDKLDRVETTFLISHNPLFAGYANQTWKVVKKDGKSSLEYE